MSAERWSTDRAHLRRLGKGDIGALHRLINDGHVKRFLCDGQSMSEAWCREAIAHSDDLFARHGVGLWGVRLERDDGTLIGLCGFRVFAEVQPEPQLLYALLETATGSGLATELARGAVEVARAEAGWPTIYAAADVPNRASLRVLTKAGFVTSGFVPGCFGEILLAEHHAAGEVLAERERWRRRAPRTVRVGSTWDGAPIDATETASILLRYDESELHVEVDAPFHGDPAPEQAPGATQRLWEHEVVELFLLGDGDRYLEVELGPHGHHLVLTLAGRRVVTQSGMPMLYRASVSASTGRWRGHARVPLAWLPRGLARMNAYAIHGRGTERRYLAWQPTGGEQPDFHRLDRFGPA